MEMVNNNIIGKLENSKTISCTCIADINQLLAYQASGCRICTSLAILVYNSSTELDVLSISADLEATVADSLSDLEDSPEFATYVKSRCFYT